MSADHTAERRLARLKQELEDECELHLPEDALEELAYCRFVEPHEGRRPSYGAVIRPSEVPEGSFGDLQDLPSPAAFRETGASIEILRMFADGRTSFLVRLPGADPALVVDTTWPGTESALAGFASKSGVTIVQRLNSGRIRLFHNDRIFSEDGGVWLQRPTALAYHEAVSLLVDEPHQKTAAAILDVCVHSLSPAGHGATLVWFPKDTAGAPDHLDVSSAITPPALSAAGPSHGRAIAHALGQLDRAVVLDGKGQVIQLNVMLRHNDDTAELHFEGGTRHTSAGRYSASQPDAIVFVVSADGPVTVFHKGEVVTLIQ